MLCSLLLKGYHEGF